MNEQAARNQAHLEMLHQCRDIAPVYVRREFQRELKLNVVFEGLKKSGVSG